MARSRAGILAATILPLSLYAQERNILANGDFESGLMCYGTSVWSDTGVPYKGDYKFFLSPDAHSGSYSLEIRCTGKDCPKASISSERIETPPGQAYKVKLFTKCPAGKTAGFYVPDTAEGNKFVELTCTGNWSASEHGFITGPKASNFSFAVYNMGAEWLRIDDVVLTYADGTVPQSPLLHAGKRDVSISDQRLLVDGKPYLALGFFDVAYADLEQAAATGANTLNSLTANISADCFNTAGKRYIDRAYELGLAFVPNSSTTAKLGEPNIFPGIVSRFSPHLANIMWFLADEPDQILVPYWYIPPPAFTAEYQAAKTKTALPFIADFQRASWTPTDETKPYTGSVDVWMAEPYGPDFKGVSHAIETFNTLSKRPIWLAQDAIDANLIVPKAYWAIIGGATGIIYYDWNSFKPDAAKLAASAQAFSELNQLKNALFASNVDRQVRAPEGVTAIARSLNGSTYILAANPQASTVKGQFKVPGLHAGEELSVLFENRSVTAEADGFTDSFPGVSRHVYLKPGAPSAVTLATEPPGLELTVDGKACPMPCALQWRPGTTHTLSVEATLKGSPGTQYIFKNWSDAGARSHSVLTPAEPLKLTAAFLTQYYLTTAANPSAGGSIHPASGWYNSGAQIPVTVATNTGYQFTGLSGDLSGAAHPQTLTLTSAASITANLPAIVQRAGWYDVFSTRRSITVNHRKVSGNLANFPVLISFNDAELKSVSQGGKVENVSGGDILFTSSDGATKLDHEVESYDPSSGLLVAWVRIPVLNSSKDTIIYVYYGKRGAADQQNKAGVWDSNYVIVNHFKDPPGTLFDSTGFKNDASVSSGAHLVPAGMAGPAYSFDGVSGSASIPSKPSWNSPSDTYSVQFWIKPGVLQDYKAAIAIGAWGSPFNIWFYPNGSTNFRMDTASGLCRSAAMLPLDGAFHEISMIYDGRASRLQTYVDTTPADNPATCSGTLTLPAGDLKIGSFATGGGFLQATIDELRVSKGVARSPGWIKTEFNNQRPGAKFFTLGPSEALGL